MAEKTNHARAWRKPKARHRARMSKGARAAQSMHELHRRIGWGTRPVATCECSGCRLLREA